MKPRKKNPVPPVETIRISFDINIRSFLAALETEEGKTVVASLAAQLLAGDIKRWERAEKPARKRKAKR